MKKLAVLLLTVMMIPAVQSCKKKQKEPEPSAKELITKDDWMLTKRKLYDSNGNLITSENPNFRWVFAPTQDFYFYDNAGDLYLYGTWELLNDDSKIHLVTHGGGIDVTLDIDELTGDKFTMSHPYGSGKEVLYLER